MNKTILITLSVFVALLAYYSFVHKDYFTSTLPAGTTPGFQKFREVRLDDVRKITLAKGKSDPVELRKEDSGWVVASAYGYPADGERVEKIVKALKGITTGTIEGENPETHKEYDVDARKGGFITLFDGAGAQLASLCVGKTAHSKNFKVTEIYLRFGDEPQTYKVESNIQSEASLWGDKADRKNYLVKDLIKIADDEEVVEARIIRPGKDDLLVERRTRDVPVEKKEEPEEAGGDEEAAAKEGEGAKEGEEQEEKKPETKKEEYCVVTSGNQTQEVGPSEKWTATSLLDRGKTVSIEDVVEPKPLDQYGLDKPQLKVVYKYRKKEKPDAELKTVTLLYGNAIKDDKGENKEYHFTIEDEKFQNRIYTSASWKLDGWNKELKDFLPKPKEEEKKPEEQKADAAPPAPVPLPGASAGSSPPAAVQPAPAQPAPEKPAAPAQPSPSPAAGEKASPPVPAPGAAPRADAAPSPAPPVPTAPSPSPPSPPAAKKP